MNVSGNDTDTGADDTEPRPSTPFEIALMVIIMLTTIVGNACVCWIIFTNHKLRTVPNKLVMNLAWCDLLTAVVNGPVTLVVLYNGEWVMGETMCQINGFTTTLFGIASVLTLAVISLNRCCMIVYSTKYSFYFSYVKTNIMISAIWIFSSLCAFPPMVGWSNYVYIPGKAICTLLWSTNISYTLFVLTLGIILPFFVMIVSYYKIFKVVQSNSRRIQSHFERASVPPSPVFGERSGRKLNVPSTKSSTDDTQPATRGHEYRVNQGHAVRLNGLFQTPLDGGSRRGSEISITSRAPSLLDQVYGPLGRRGSTLSIDPVTMDRPTSAISGRLAMGGSSRQLPRQGPRIEDVKITKTVLIVLLAFVVCWSPISVVNFLETFFNYTIPMALDLFTVYMVFLNCALNPIIYGLMNRNFRKGFKKIFCFCKTGALRKQRSVGAVIAIHSAGESASRAVTVNRTSTHKPRGTKKRRRSATVSWRTSDNKINAIIIYQQLLYG
ncbi:putative G-protein coupled receptor No18 [Saccoglossus kowalevskii]|uniref:5-hydroxytryptamine receptor 1-like n=1 Tax=Saccoglossus kowalevskii TaxID=10224 RepID=A0ABM0H1A3_SACKO|nr:PREDICTED: 5-hydroxytryptamine receptor 1-like [Saccoglossus kowalevskii]